MACSSTDSPDLLQMRTESIWAKPAPYVQVCASGANTREHLTLSGLQRICLPQSPPRNASSSSLAWKHQKNLPGSRVPWVSWFLKRQGESCKEKTREEGRGLLTTAAGMGCRPQVCELTLCTRGAVQDGRVPCQARCGWQDEFPHGAQSSSLTSWGGGHVWS